MSLTPIPESVEKELIKHDPLVRRLLFNRGIIDGRLAEEFLNPNYERDVSDPFLMTDLEKAVERIYEAVTSGERICVFADYDCDGIPGAVIWNDLFEKIGFQNFEIYIPDRHKEGYGLNRAALDEIAGRGAKLLVTVDLGIVAIEDVEYANGLGLVTIVSDHHLPKENLPKAFAVVNPKREDCAYPDEMLCGAGVSFKIIQGFLQKHGEEFGVSAGFEKWLLDMVGLATLSDMVPLRKENRALAFFGLKVLRKTRRPGLLKLFSDARINPRLLQEDDITFSICPKLNAAGRMDSPRRAYEVLSIKGEAEAVGSAEHLVKLNNQRKILVAGIMKSVKKTLFARPDNPVIVIGDPAWRIGVLGLVAGKIADEYKKPAFVWGLEGGEVIKGSCRSDGLVNLVELMGHLPKEALLEFGGHEGAGGFSVSHEEIHFLEERLVEAHGKIKKEIIDPDSEAVTDGILEFDDVNEKTFREIDGLAPFGVANPKPVFEFPDAQVFEIKLFGKAKEHLEISFKDSTGRIVKAVTFFKSPESFGVKIAPGEKIKLLASVEKSVFGRKEEIRLRIVDVQ